MKIALPVSENKLCAHFGHCDKFAFIEVDIKSRTVLGRKDVSSPPHQPGLLPSWIKDNGADIVIAGGMGQRAQSLFQQHGIEVITGCLKTEPEEIVNDYLHNNLQTGSNACDH